MGADDKTATQLPKKIELYLDSKGKSPFAKWRSKQKGSRGAAIDQVLDRVKGGETVKVKSYDGKVGAIIINWPTKLRIYYGLADDNTVVLLGGDEDSQDNDIDQAKRFWEDYVERGDDDG